MKSKILAIAVALAVLISGCVGGITANENEKAVGNDVKSLFSSNTANVKSYSLKAGDSIDLDVVEKVAGVQHGAVLKGTCGANRDEAGTEILGGCGGRKITIPDDITIYVGIDCGLFGGKTMCSVDFCTGNEAWCAIKQATWKAIE